MINISKLYCGVAGESDQLRYVSKKSIHPVAVFNCTPKCNLKCIHCYSYSEPASADQQLTTAEAKELISQLAEFGCQIILFSGGEPLIREDIFELIAYAGSLGLRPVLSTNGTLIDEPMAEELARLNVGYVGISIDGPEKIHDKFRNKTGAFAASVRGIENCRNVGLKTGLRFTITKANADDIDWVFDLADQTAVRRICFYHLIRTGRAIQASEQTPSKEQTRKVLDTIIQKTDTFVANDLVDEVLTVGNHADGPYLLTVMNRRDHPLTSSALNLLMAAAGNRTGQNIASISWDGSVYPDQFWRNYSLGNIKEKSFRNIWDNNNEPVLRMLRNKTKYRDNRCAKCKWFSLCKGNYRSLSADAQNQGNWLNEPPCYLTDYEIGIES